MHFDPISTQTHKETSRERRSFLHPQIWSKVQLTELLSPLSPKQSKSGYFSGKKNSRTWVRPYVLISIHITIHSIRWAQHGGIKLLQLTKSKSEFTPSVLLLLLHTSLFKPLYHPIIPSNRPLSLNQNYSLLVALPILYSNSWLKSYRTKSYCAPIYSQSLKIQFQKSETAHHSVWQRVLPPLFPLNPTQ